jgi:hypothetical protein
MATKLILKIWACILICVLGAMIISGAACAKDPRDEESIKAFLDQYFSSWSNGDMDAYKDCFHPKATVVILDRANAPQASYPLDAFIRTQEQAHQESLVKMREIPLDKQITTDDNVSQATVRWKLFKGDRTVTGVDLFTLVLTSGEWKILHLTVRND